LKPQTARPPLVLVTRPQGPGRALAAQLRAADLDALWLPAFTLLPADDPAALASSVERLALFDLVVFVSPAAVHAFAPLVTNAWPAHATIAAVGAASARVARAQLPGAHEARIVCPDGETAAEGGSEALWPALQKALPTPPRHALIVRAQTGRSWLTDRLLECGASVEEAVAYRRVRHVPTPIQWAALRAAWSAGARLAPLYSSSEAVAVMADAFGHEAALSSWLLGGVCLCVHERIERTLRASGRTDVRRCEPDVASIQKALGLAATDWPGSPTPHAKRVSTGLSEIP